MCFFPGAIELKHVLHRNSSCVLVISLLADAMLILGGKGGFIVHLAILQTIHWQRSSFLDVLVDKSSYLIRNLNSDLKPISKFAKRLLHVSQEFFLDNLEYHCFSLSSNAFLFV